MTIQEGKWRAKATTLELRKSDKGARFVATIFQIEDGPSKGELIEWNGWLSDKAKARTVQSLNSMGFDGDNLQSAKGEVFVVIENEEYNGKSYPKVKWINDIRRSFGETMSMHEIAEVMSDLKATSLALRHELPKLDPNDQLKF